MASLKELLEQMVDKGASDLHLTAGCPPQIRIDGTLVPASEEILTPETTQQLAYSVLTNFQKKQYEEDKELDLSIGVKGLGRFRINVFRQRGGVAAAIRAIPYEIRGFEELGLPKVVQTFADKPKGLLLVTGPTGSGKSTTLAAIINKINMEQHKHILTIEDPIEYLHKHRGCMINQREVHSDTESFPKALKYVLRQDPDVILIGEMRDLETIEAALTIAETGHLVFATLHTNDAAQTINRIIDVFPSHQQQQVRTQLSFVLEGILAQQLIPKSSGSGRALAIEIMVTTPGIRALIRDDKVHQIYTAMQTGQKFGMLSLNQSLFNLYQRRLISYEEAMNHSPNLDDLLRMIQEKGGARRPVGR